MALYDVDKQNGDRANPSINADDNLMNRMSHKTIGTSYKQAGNQASARMIFDKDAIVGSHDENTKDIFIGYNPAINPTRPVVRIAKDGLDAVDADDDELIFNSEQNIFKIIKSDTATQNVPSLAQDVTTTLTVPHGLGYIPATIVFLNGTDSTYLTANQYYPPPISVPVKVGATYYPGIIYEYTVDSTNIYFMVTNRSAATPITNIGTANWKYYLLQETAD